MSRALLMNIGTKDRRSQRRAGSQERRALCEFWGSNPWNLVNKKAMENVYFGLDNESVINSVVNK